MNNVRPHMLGINGVGFPPSSTAGGNLGNINGLGAMGGMGNMGGMGGLGNMGGMGAMAGGGGGGGGGQHQHQQHPGQHAPAMGLLQNHQPQQHTNPPPMGGLQPGGNQPGQNQGASGVQPQLGQQPNGIQFMGVRDQMLRQTFERQRFQQQQAQAQQQQQQQQQQQSQQQQQQQMPHQQGQQQQQLQPQPGAFLAGMSHMGNFGSPRSANLVHTGSTNGMSAMAGLGGMGGMGIGGGAGFQSIPPGAGAGMALRRVPSQTGQPNQSQPPVGGAGNAGMNMGMVSGMGVGGMNSVGLGMPASLNNLRQGGMPGVQQQRMTSYPGAQQQPPGPLAPGQQRSVSSMAHVPPEVAAVITQEQRHREQHQQQQQAQAHMQQQQQQQQHGLQHPRTPSVVNANPPMPPNASINNANTNGGPIPNAMNPNAIGAPGMQRTPSAQSMGAPPGGMHPSHPNHPNHANPNLPHGQQQPNPPPFTNPLHHSMQNPQMQHQQHQHQQLGGQQQQHHLGQHAHQQPSGMSGVPMPGMPGTNHVPNANAMPGGMQGHPSQQRSNAGSPPRPGTSGHSQPQTPSIPVSAASMRPQSRAGEQQPMIGFPGGAGQPQFGGAMRQPGSHQHPHPHPHPPGQQGQLGNPYGAQGVGMGGRATPQHTQSPMAALGSSPGGPISGRPGSSGGPGPGGVGAGGMSTPNLGMVGLGGRAGPVPPGGPVPGAGGGFPTPAQQLAEQQAARTSTMGAYAGAMPPLTAQPHNMNTPGSGPLGAPQRPPTSQAHSHAHPPPPFASPVHHHQQQRTGSPAVHRQPTPALQQAGPLARMGTPTLAQGLGQPPPGVHAHALQQNRSPSRVRTPSRQQNHAQAGPGAGQGQGQGQGQAQTPRTQAAQLPTTPGAGSSAAGATAGRAPPMGTMGRQGVGLGISPMHGGPPAAGQQQQPPNAGAQPQQQNATTAGQQRPITQDGSNPPPNMGMMSMTPYLAQRQSMFTPMQAIGRLMSFSDTLSQPKLPSSKEYWEGLVAEYFSSKAVVKITLWKDNAQQEAKPFDITVPILPRFFLVTSQSGVSSMTINFEGAKERPVPGNPYSAFVDCPNAAWTYYYYNGYIVTLRGSLTATLVWVPNTTQPPPIANGAQPPPVPLSLKIETMTFNSEKHEKALRVEAIQGRRSDPVQRTPKMMMMMKAEGSPGAGSSSTIASAESTPALEDERNGAELVIHFDRATIPTEPVNAFGIPQATMRCLELAESVGHMSELIEFTLQTGFRPLDALKNYAHMLREQGYMLQPTNQNSPGQLMDAHLTNGVATSPAVTLYQTSPPVEHATTNSGGLQPPPNMSHRPGANTGQGPGDTSSPNMSSTPASAQTPNPPPLSAAPTSTSSTPMVPHATLKRKAGDTSSPTTATAEQQQPPAKRAQRKRSVRH